MDTKKINRLEILTTRATVTAREYAALNGISELTARRLAYSGEIKSMKIGHSLRIPVSEIAGNN